MERALAFGRELQRERERRGVSLDAVADGTKVAPRYLRALESDDVRNLPGGIFNKGFVRSYCRFLGLNEDEWLQRFSRAVPAANDEIDFTEFAENVKRTRIQTAPAMRRRWWGVVLMLLALGAAAWSLWHYVLQERLSPAELPTHTTAPIITPSAAPTATAAAPSTPARTMHHATRGTSAAGPSVHLPADTPPTTAP